ncbi:MAG: hypothetical protein ACYTGG_09065 [Planctomycetota bacterium]|jgi:hypothetical protein
MTRSTHVIPIVVAALLTTAAGAAEFHMIHSTRGNAAIGVFTPEGPRLGTMQKAPRRVDFITYDAGSGTYFGQQTSTLGVIENGKLTPVEMPDSVDLSHAGGLAFDAERGSVLVASRDGGGTVLFEYAVADNTWTEIGNVGRDDFQGLACDPAQETIYILDKPHHARGCTNVRVFNRTGAQVAAVDLSTPIPFYSELRPRVQLAVAEGILYAMVSFEEKHPRVTDAIYAIDPASGEVSRMPYNASADLMSKTWPGWKEGPDPSSPMAAAGAQGRGHYSNYQTPRRLVKRQAGELHVVAVETGDTNYLEWLKKVKSVRASSRQGGGVNVEVELDLDAETQHPVVEVFVGKTAKPVTLALVSGSSVVWSIEAAPDARISKVITFDAPFFSASKVIGVEEGMVTVGGQMRAAHAWEMQQSSSASRFGEMIETIRDASGLRENSFQGLGRGAAFSVPLSATRQGERQRASVDSRPE